MLKEKAIEYFINGYSCSEAVIKAGIDAGICPEFLLPCATAFSGGMSDGCCCGAVTAGQMILGAHFGRENKENNSVCARETASELMQTFKETFKVTCCRVLSRGIAPADKKQHCSQYVAKVCDIIEKIIQEKNG